MQIVNISFRFIMMEYNAFGVDLWGTLKDDDKSSFVLISMGNALEGIESGQDLAFNAHNIINLLLGIRWN